MKGVPCKTVAGACGVRNAASVRQAFLARGLPVRVWESGHFQATHKPRTWVQVLGIIGRQTRMCVPAELRYDWRKFWTLAQKQKFLREMRAHLGIPELVVRLEGARVFDAACPVARQMMAEVNGGLPSRLHRMRLKAATRGVLFEGQLWFWAEKHGFVNGARTKTLYHHIYERYHAPVPPGMRVRFLDGDPMHLEPGNLYLASADEVCRENHAKALERTAAKRMTAMLNLQKTKGGPNHE
ncbi:MAG TPA: hypothetical protein DIT13_19670 [Verrucomicrobiales bacterium]|nr:hypothetical protein [Verrucomicrobiales bacterium]